MFEKSLKGGRRYWSWVAFLLALICAGFIVYLRQWGYGLGITGMSRDVSWGLYIANFTFFVGVAASAVMVVLPYYLHDVKAFAKTVILGEFLAVAAIVVSVLFVVVDLGRPDRAFNILLYASPTSMLFWDVIALSGYFVLNLFIGWSSLDAESKGEKPVPWVRPLIVLSIPWAVSIHTVTAFIYMGLVARPLWHTALWAPRFLASAFASGPSLLIILALIIKRFAKFDIGKEAMGRLTTIVTYALLANIFLQLVEFFVVFYGYIPEDASHLTYLFWGIGNKGALVPWMWLSSILSLAAAVLLLVAPVRRNSGLLAAVCSAIFVSIWIDKGLGLIIPGFIPNPLGAITQYYPTVMEGLICLGVWALGFLIVTVLYKIVMTVRKS